ncbi:MAG: hypothetical protein IGR80_06235 [Synechococcales cyanobacterium K44_A2020_017]|nr:hypothetical protein [Synechococcales cyanobacterium K32_A2020_035]MBF2094340.1 hypothetical protein [Synechococcales cyanobacterium K44_A2020_017]
MVDPIDNIAYQARQGSVAAIIQILNEKLADSGVRVRAVFEDNKLQLLCEAATIDQLDQTVLVERVKSMLEAMSPRSIRRVSMHSRLVQEQQLLWLDEIRREPDKLLWSQEIRLRSPNPIQRWLQDMKHDRSSTRSTLPKAAKKSDQGFWRGIVGGISLSLLLLVVGWAVSKWLGLGWANQVQTVLTGEPEPLPEEVEPEVEPVETGASEPEPTMPPEPPAFDPFAQAVDLAQQAAEAGGEAQSAAEWLELAARWQRAADLMNQVDVDDPRYETAQSRVRLYQENSQTALAEAGNR